MTYFVADFETTTREDDCRVWAYGIVEVENQDNYKIGTTIDEFMDYCEHELGNVTVLFHNLKFDSQFIMAYLFRQGFTHTEEVKDRATRTFNTVIGDDGMYYSLEVVFEKRGKKVNKITFQDSLKLIPLSVDKIAKAFKMPMQKLKIDYKAHDNLPVGAPLTHDEEEYLLHDILIVAKAVDYFHKQGLDKMTIGSCALAEYKKLLSKREYKRYYPEPQYHKDVKPSYKGGFTCLNPKFAGKEISHGVVLDVNSLYPSVMYGADDEYLPFSTPLFYFGKYKDDPVHPLYIQSIMCQFKIKPGKIPTIQVKHGGFKSNEYLRDSGSREVNLVLTSVDLELFFEHYDVYNLTYVSGWKFKATKGLFKDYIEKWSNAKIQAKLDGNHGMYLISKLFLNSLYGKFGTDIEAGSKRPYLGDDGIVHFRKGVTRERKPLYIGIAAFITAYARRKTITASQRITDNHAAGLSKAEWIYSDTDSLHILLNGESEEEFFANCGLDIDPTKLGAWDYEAKFKKAKFLRQKCYVEYMTEDTKSENPDYHMKVTVAGMPKNCHDQVTFENFQIGAVYKGKLLPKIVKGGCILEEVDFSIKIN